MLHKNNEYFSDKGQVIRWRLPIDYKFVNFSKMALKQYFPGLLETFDKSKKLEEGYQLNDIYTKTSTEKALFYYTEEEIILNNIHYPFRFNVPRSCVIQDETMELNEPYTIIINDWAYRTCYLQAIDKILEDWGKTIFSLLSCNEDNPVFQFSPQKELINKLKNHENKNVKNNDNFPKKRIPSVEIETNDRHENIQAEKHVYVRSNIQDEPNTDNKKGERTMEESKKDLIIFFTDGAGNIYKNIPNENPGHYNIILTNTKEKWQKKEDLTSNQAELKGVIGALIISIKRGYEHVVINTDSKMTCNLSKGVWKAKNDNIKSLVDTMLQLQEKIPNLVIKWIERDKNLAHDII